MRSNAPSQSRGGKAGFLERLKRGAIGKGNAIPIRATSTRIKVHKVGVRGLGAGAGVEVYIGAGSEPRRQESRSTRLVRLLMRSLDGMAHPAPSPSPSPFHSSPSTLIRTPHPPPSSAPSPSTLHPPPYQVGDSSQRAGLLDDQDREYL